MKLKDCIIGKVVCLKDITVGDNYGKPVIKTKRGDKLFNQPEVFSYLLVGHITGFDLNCQGETIVIVLWNDFTKQPIHPAQLLECEE